MDDLPLLVVSISIILVLGAVALVMRRNHRVARVCVFAMAGVVAGLVLAGLALPVIVEEFRFVYFREPFRMHTVTSRVWGVTLEIAPFVFVLIGAGFGAFFGLQWPTRKQPGSR